MNGRALFLLVLLSGFSCSNEEDLAAPVDDVQPAITEVGSAIGDAVTLEMGPNGGTISSADGLLEVSVPAGTVAANTSFSIQPVSNFCPGGYRAYHLLPEGLTFSKPLTLTFHYTDDDLAGTSTEFLGVAFQGSEGEWNLVKTALDDDAKTLSTETTHFSTWVMVSNIVITPQYPAVPRLEIDKSLNLVVRVVDHSSPTSSRSRPQLARQRDLQATWFVNGVENGNTNVGTLQLAGNQVSVIYKAPDSAPVNNPVAISAQFSGIHAWDFFNNRRVTYNNVTVAKHVKIIDQYNFKLEVFFSNQVLSCFAGSQYEDKVELDIHVERGTATITELVNSDAWVIPETHIVGNCTTTCIPGVGALHISSGSVEITRYDPNDPDPFLFVVLNNDGINPGHKIVCPDTPTVNLPSTPTTIKDFVQTFHLTEDSRQTRSSDGLTFWALTPE
jgi:hypothetical protein